MPTAGVNVIADIMPTAGVMMIAGVMPTAGVMMMADIVTTANTLVAADIVKRVPRVGGWGTAPHPPHRTNNLKHSCSGAAGLSGNDRS
jgi:hypothetical protein